MAFATLNIFPKLKDLVMNSSPKSAKVLRNLQINYPSIPKTGETSSLI